MLLGMAGLSLASKALTVASAIQEHGEELGGAFTVITPGTVRIRRHP